MRSRPRIRTPERSRELLLAAILLVGLLLASASHPQESHSAPLEEEEVRAVLTHWPLPPPPVDPTNEVDGDPRAIELGRRLFFDCRLSASEAVSCASCHRPDRQWADGEALSSNFDLDRHVPSLWNTAYNRWYFWDGRADSLWAQALQPLENPREHGATRSQILETIRSDPALYSLFEELFGPLPPKGDPSGEQADGSVVTNRAFAAVGKSIAAFVATLVTGESRFDRFAQSLAEGEPDPEMHLTAQELRGLRLFVGRARCSLCHSGPNFSDSQFHDIRIRPSKGAPEPARYEGISQVLVDPFNGLGRYSAMSEGPEVAELRFLRRSAENWGQYKTPSLRNVALTPPYMHQGQLPNLDSVVAHYSTFENALPAGHHAETFLVPLDLSSDEVDSLVAFLKTLSSETQSPGRHTAPCSSGREVVFTGSMAGSPEYFLPGPLIAH